MNLPTLTVHVHSVTAERDTHEVADGTGEMMTHIAGDVTYQARTVDGDCLTITKAEHDRIAAELATTR